MNRNSELYTALRNLNVCLYKQYLNLVTTSNQIRRYKASAVE